jgi:DNA polymerase Ligase (LigD)
MPRFVILTHDYPFLHWDLLLEQTESLKTWRLLEEPATESLIEVEPLADHRLLYLDYEGPVSRNRGSVTQWDKGEYEIISSEDSSLLFKLKGNRINGIYRIEKRDKKTFLVREE